MATGPEMMLNTVFKFLGVDKDDMLKMFFATRDMVYSADTRLAAIQNELAAQRVIIEAILKRSNGDKPNGSAGTEHGHGNGPDPDRESGHAAESAGRKSDDGNAQ
jgi:hypothetical protein